MRALALVALCALVGCGEVTEIPAPLPDAVAPLPDAVAPELGQVDGGRDASVLETTAADVGGPELAPPLACIPAGCAGCAQPAADGAPGFSSATCAAIVACVRAGDGGGYPWQGCANMHSASLAAAGLACAQRVDQACPP